MWWIFVNAIPTSLFVEKQESSSGTDSDGESYIEPLSGPHPGNLKTLKEFQRVFAFHKFCFAMKYSFILLTSAPDQNSMLAL